MIRRGPLGVARRPVTGDRRAGTASAAAVPAAAEHRLRGRGRGVTVGGFGCPGLQDGGGRAGGRAAGLLPGLGPGRLGCGLGDAGAGRGGGCCDAVAVAVTGLAIRFRTAGVCVAAGVAVRVRAVTRYVGCGAGPAARPGGTGSIAGVWQARNVQPAAGHVEQRGGVAVGKCDRLPDDPAQVPYGRLAEHPGRGPRHGRDLVVVEHPGGGPPAQKGKGRGGLPPLLLRRAACIIGRRDGDEVRRSSTQVDPVAWPVLYLAAFSARLFQQRSCAQHDRRSAIRDAGPPAGDPGVGRLMRGNPDEYRVAEAASPGDRVDIVGVNTAKGRVAIDRNLGCHRVVPAWGRLAGDVPRHAKQHVVSAGQRGDDGVEAGGQVITSLGQVGVLRHGRRGGGHLPYLAPRLSGVTPG